MKCPKCHKEGCSYIDRKETTRKIGKGKKKHHYKTMTRKRAYLKINDKGDSDTSVRENNIAKCNKCGFEGEIK